MEFNITDFKSLKEFFKTIYYRKISTYRVEVIQNEFSNVLDALKRYSSKDSEYINNRLKLVNNAMTKTIC